MAQVEAITTQQANLYVLSAEFPAGEEFNIGVLLEDMQSNQLHLKMRRDWDVVAPDDYYDYLRALDADFQSKAAEMGAHEFLTLLTSQLSNFLRITDPQKVMAGKFPRTLALLYERHVHPKPLAYQTHLPLYTLRSAAGKFLENAAVCRVRRLGRSAGRPAADAGHVRGGNSRHVDGTFGAGR